MSTQFLTVEDVAKSLNVTRQTVSKYIQDESLNAVKMNKSYRISLEDFEQFVVRKSTLKETSFTYARKTRNCQLEYSGKVSEKEVLSTDHHGDLRVVRKAKRGALGDFIFGDNLLVLSHLLKSYKSKVDLVYIDPPFGTGQDFNSIDNQTAYSDKLVDREFLEFLRKRLILIRELMSEQGSIYLHIDKKIGHYVKIIMDEVFGYDNFINDITRIKCNPKNFARNAYGNYSDMILYYAKNRDQQIWNDIKEPMSSEKRQALFPKKHPRFGYYTTNPIHAPGETLDGDTGQEWKGIKPPKGRHWRYSRKVLDELDAQGLIEWSTTGNPRKIVLAKEHKGFKIQDVWEFKDKGLSYVDYPTQKNFDMLEQIILNSSTPESIVLDCFAGSGSTLLTANKLGRKWIGVDNSTHSFKVIADSFEKLKINARILEYSTLD